MIASGCMCTCCIVILGWISIKLPVLSDNYMFNQPSIKFPVLFSLVLFWLSCTQSTKAQLLIMHSIVPCLGTFASSFN
jgi:hypothetical protein